MSIEEAKTNLINGRVYKIYNTADPNKIYVGSTKETLTRRLQKHKANAKSGRTSRFCNYLRQHNYENFRIVLLEEVKYEHSSQLREREDRYIIDLHPELNMHNAILNHEKVKQCNNRYNNSDKGKLRALRYREKLRAIRNNTQIQTQTQTQEQIQT